MKFNQSLLSINGKAKCSFYFEEGKGWITKSFSFDDEGKWDGTVTTDKDNKEYSLHVDIKNTDTNGILTVSYNDCTCEIEKYDPLTNTLDISLYNISDLFFMDMSGTFEDNIYSGTSDLNSSDSKFKLKLQE